MISNILSNKPLPVYGKGQNSREWIYVNDHCDALYKIFKKGKIGESYNVGSNANVKNINLIKLIINIFKKRGFKIGKKVKIKFVKDRPGHDLRYSLNSKKIFREIKWHSKTDLNEGLDMTIDWYLRNKKFISSISKYLYVKRLGLKIAIKKGIILAGGLGSRMSPITKAVNKQLLPIYDKPLIFYPLSVLMLAGIREILIIVNKGQVNQFKKILGNGENFGVRIQFKEQKTPNGLPEAFIIGEKFIDNSNVALILGDNFFYAQSLTKSLQKATKLKNGAKVFLHPVKNPKLYGIATIKNKKL